MPWIDRGYVRRKQRTHPRAAFNGGVAEHVLIAEKALGKFIPKKHPIHHHNEIRSDNRNANLVICESGGYHSLLHLRMRVVAAGGDPNTQKFCCVCKQLKPKADFCKYFRCCDGLDQKCTPCKRVAQRAWRAKNPEKVHGYSQKQILSGYAREHKRMIRERKRRERSWV